MNAPAPTAVPTASAAPVSHQTAERIPLSTLLTLAALSALATLSTNIMLPSLPEIAGQLQLTPAQGNSLLSVFFAVFAVAQLFVGPWSDRIGRHRLVVGGIVVFIVGAAVCAIADSLAALLAGRVIQALGVAAASVLARAAARDRYEGQTLTRLLGLIMVVMAAAPGFSPLIGGLIHQAVGWRGVFATLCLAALVIGLAWSKVLGETLPADRRNARPATSILADYRRLLLDVRFAAPALAVAAIMGALFAFFAATPPILMTTLGMSPLQVGLFFAATVFIVFGGGTLAPRLAARYGPVIVVRAGVALACAGGIGLWALSVVGPLSLVGYAIAISVFLLGMGITSPVGTALAMTPFAQQAGQASALVGFLQMAAAALTTTLTALLIGPRGAALAWLPGPAVLAAADALAIVLTSASLLALLVFSLARARR